MRRELEEYLRGLKAMAGSRKPGSCRLIPETPAHTEWRVRCDARFARALRARNPARADARARLINEIDHWQMYLLHGGYDQ